MKWLPLLRVVALIAGCGSSDKPEVHSDDLRRLKPVPAATADPPPAATDIRAYLRQVFEDAESMWDSNFRTAGLEYKPARFTIFEDEVQTACGTHPAGTGPFYCIRSAGVYLDPRFFTALSRRVGVPIGAFAQAYVVAHEVAHHVQTLLGITRQKAEADRKDPDGANARSVRFELQADCFAGVWAHSAYRQGAVSGANIQDALNAAAVVGDDFQARLAGRVRPPEDFSHGTSAQRQQWFKTGFTRGDPAACDTFST